ncbi:MAG: iron ABC transporter permease [Coleofasciculaceae cyanobacterium RL_1_1]|nr:iron ABC transporter permease [Coleofasciculaceae cyanobacterium RL_1_1]
MVLRSRTTIAALGLGTLLILTLWLELSFGSVRIPLGEMLTILLGGEPTNPAWKTIVFSFRLPKALTAIATGIALPIAGLQMQTLFGNPLAGPFVLGIGSGASLGVAIVVLLGGVWAGSWGRVGAASLGATLVLVLVAIVAQRIRSRETLLLLGLMFGYATNAIVTILLHFSNPDQIQAYLIWTFGSFSGVTWDRLGVLGVAVMVGTIAACALANPLNLLLLGETTARSLGLSVRAIFIGTIISTAILVGAVTAFCGPIAFLGIAVPHLSRSLLRTSDVRQLIPTVALLGATLALLSDWLAQLPGLAVVLPLNAVTAILGTPIVVHAILRRSHLRS